MSSSLPTSTENFYKILGLSANASQSEIKKSRDRLARKYHPDKVSPSERDRSEDLMKKINDAYATLSDPGKRQAYDSRCDDDEDGDEWCGPMAGHLHGGPKLSDIFRAKIFAWSRGGVPSSDNTPFTNVARAAKIHLNPITLSGSGMKRGHPMLFARELPAVEAALQKALPREIWQWSYSTPEESAMLRQIFNGEGWSAPLSSVCSPLPSEVESGIEEGELLHTIEALQKNAVKVPSLEGKELDSRASSFFTPRSTPFFSTKPSPLAAGSRAPLFSRMSGAGAFFGHIPDNTVSPPKALQKAESCSGCKKSFGIFRWEHNCTNCGKACCDDCLQYKDLPNYSEPAKVGSCCDTRTLLEETKNEWVAPLERSEVRKVITPNYLNMIAHLGAADEKSFLRWLDLFLAEGRGDLAIQCCLLGKGEWQKLADLFIERKMVGEAAYCLGRVGGSIEQWKERGFKEMERSPEIAYLYFKRAGLGSDDFFSMALERPFDRIAALYLAIAFQTTPASQRAARREKLIAAALAGKNYPLVAHLYTKAKEPLQKWVELVNRCDHEAAQFFMASIEGTFKNCNFATLCLNPDKIHLSWPYRAPKKFDGWFPLLFDQLKQGNGTYAIPYFRAHVSDGNFVVRRDEFLKQGAYSEALICHRLAPNSIPWGDLARKWRGKDEKAALLCTLLDPEGVNAAADQYYRDGYRSLALCCYLSAKNLEAIAEKAKGADNTARLLYLLALYRARGKSPELLLDIVKAVKGRKTPSLEIKDLALAALKEKPERPIALQFAKILAESELSEEELRGLADEISPLCSSEEEKKFHLSLVQRAFLPFERELRQALGSHSYMRLFLSLEKIERETLPIIEKLLGEYKLETLPHSPLRSMVLLLAATVKLVRTPEPQLFDAMNDIIEAMLINPSEDCIQLCCKLVEKIGEKNSQCMKGRTTGGAEFSKTNSYSDRLQRNPMLKMIVRAEKAIAAFAPFEAAMTTIDLSMALSHPASLAAGFLKAASELLAEEKKGSCGRNEKYAYRKAITELVSTAAFVAKTHLSPTMRLYTLRGAIAILTEAFAPFQAVSKEEAMLLEELYNESNMLADVAPVVMSKMLGIYDTIYLNLISNSFLEKYLPEMRDLHGENKPIYQYYLFEGCWKGWIDQEKFSFEEERLRTMKALLHEKGNDIGHVEALMNWPALPRDKEGWLLQNCQPLRLAGDAYARIDGISFNMTTGEISLMLRSSSYPQENLFDATDIGDIMREGVGAAFFTLDQPDPSMRHHPFQNMAYAPEALSRTNYLATMLHADLLLKMLSMGTEVSGKAPFAFRSADDHLLRRLPERLRNKFKELRKEVPHTAGRVHRFWIEAGELPYAQQSGEHGVTFTFGDCKMYVKKHLMRYDSEGKLVDTDSDEENDSPEAKFAKLMTDEYDTLGKYFPELARLKELLKLQAVSLIAQNIHQNVKEQVQTLSIDRNAIIKILHDVKGQIKYPLAAEQNVEKELDDCLRKQGFSRYQVPGQQLTELKNSIRNQLREADSSHFGQIVDVLAKNFDVTDSSTLNSLVSSWLNYGYSDQLVNLLESSKKRAEINKLSRIFTTYERGHIAVKPNSSPVIDRCTWVPAAFSICEAGYKIYGGVNMQTKLSSIPGGTVEHSRGVNSLPPKGGGSLGPGAAGYGARYIEGCTAQGRMYGTMTAVNSVAGQTYRTLDLGGCVRDQYNASQRINTTHLWKSYVGYTTTEHYTHHTNNAVHIHHTSGSATCTNAQGVSTTYRSGDPNHRC